MHSKTCLLAFVTGLMLQAPVHAMGLRSFVALPVDKGGAVLRMQWERNDDAAIEVGIANAAYGLSAKQTLLFGLPYRLTPGGNNRRGDLSALYRHTVQQMDSAAGTRRLGLLGGIIIPTASGRDGAVQGGFVYTDYQGRHEFDADLLLQAGLDDRADSGRYDLSWQYRLTPADYPDWGTTRELNGVLELNGRWTEGNTTVHQVTLGLQWVHPRWVLEGGVFKDVNDPNATHYLVSTRFHF